MWHPVGVLPARVYWRRRALLLLGVLALLAAAGWLGWWLLSGRSEAPGATASTAASAATSLPALERVVPALGEGLRTPESAAGNPWETPLPETAPSTGAESPVAGGPCADDVLVLEVRAPATVTLGSKPVLELVVRNASAVPCVRVLDKQLQEIALFDAAGARVWGSNDCFPESSDDTRTLAPGEEAVFPLVWGGRTSEPSCTAARTAPAAGSYVLRGQLDTKVSADTPLALVGG